MYNTGCRCIVPAHHELGAKGNVMRPPAKKYGTCLVPSSVHLPSARISSAPRSIEREILPTTLFGSVPVFTRMDKRDVLDE
jgi:hypothetical protein